MERYRQMTDHELVQLILQNDNHAMGELYNRYHHKVYLKCLSLVRDRDEASDLAEESLIRAFDKLHAFRGSSSFSTWLYIITHRHCLGYLRKKNKSPDWLIAGLLDDGDSYVQPSDEMITQDTHAIMLTLIDNLPEQERALLLMKYYQGESIESLHLHLNLSASAVKMRLKRSKEKLNYLYSIAITSGLATALALL